MHLFKKILFIFVGLCFFTAQAEIVVKDDIGEMIVLPHVAKRVISLAPHTTELLYVAGGDEQVIGAVSFSDYPEKAKQLTRVGSYNKFDLETIVSLNPDLIVAWESGNTMSKIDEVKKLGIKVFVNEPRTFDDIQKSIINLGKLLGTEEAAEKQADLFGVRLKALQEKNKNKSTVRVFYQVWNDPLFTINGDHLINRAIDLCGGDNVFKDLNVLSPQVSVEAVIEQDPDAIIAGTGEGRSHWLGEWKKWQAMKAVKNQHLYAINADVIVRHTPRILQGAEMLCQHLDKVRAN